MNYNKDRITERKNWETEQLLQQIKSNSGEQRIFSNTDLQVKEAISQQLKACME